MSKSKEETTRDKEYARLRTEFEDLSMEDRAVFLVESSVSTILRGIERVGSMLSDEVDHIFREPDGPEGSDRGPGDEKAGSDEPGKPGGEPAKPGASRRGRSTSAKRKTTRKPRGTSKSKSPD